MDPQTAAFLYVAGVVGGIVSVLVSMASLVTYPALLATGLGPVSANVTNTVSLVFTGIGATLSGQRELRGQRQLLAPLAVVSAVGGAIGAALLLLLPGRAFELVVPVLVAGSSLALLVQPRLRDRPVFQPQGLRPGPVIAFLLVSVYIGYFGAAGGILSLVALGAIIARPFIELNAAKNTLSMFANAIAAAAFIAFGPVAWASAVPLAAGLFTGGLIGPRIARRVPGSLLRTIVAACGLVVAVVLGWRAYGAG